VLRIGTRGSALALYQANTVAGRLRQAGVAVDVVVIRTSGDRLAEAALSEIGGKRVFVKEIEDALLAGTIDLAVHSAKDLPVVLPDGLEIAAVLPREDPRDALVLPPMPDSDPEIQPLDDVLRRLGPAPRIGTSSVRRVAQLARLVPDAAFLPIRGNVDTRLRKLDDGEFEAIVLAAAGLRRLGFASRISAMVPAAACVPAPGQGIIAIETRTDDDRARAPLHVLDDGPARVAFDTERVVVRRLGGGCQMPIGAFADMAGDTLRVDAIVSSLDGGRAVRAAAAGPPDQADDLGAEVAARLLAEGAAEILADVEATRAGGAPGGRA